MKNSTNLLKYAGRDYFYHGTGIQNLKSILSEGLVSGKKLVYDDSLNRYNSLKSYGGNYLTSDISVALTSGYRSSNKNQTKKIEKNCLVMVSIETKTPHILLDEDLLVNPSLCLNSIVNLEGIPSFKNPYDLAWFISNTLDSQMNNMIDCYINRMLKERHPEIDDRVFENLKPYIANLIRSFCLRYLAASALSEYDTYEKERFDKQFPQFSHVTLEQQEIQYRNAADLLMRKGHRLTEDIDYYKRNVRSLENIGYKGSNKIILVAEVAEKEKTDDYYKKINILYISDYKAVERLKDDLSEKISRKILITYGNEIIYDGKEFEY